MGAGETDAYLGWTAAYVLGSLDTQERHELEKHLLGCSRCAGAVRDFAPVPALLSAIPDEEALSLGRGMPHPPQASSTALAGKVRHTH